MARVHRIGQTRTCHVYRFCTSGTIEQRVQQRAEKKLFLDQMVNSGHTESAKHPCCLFFAMHSIIGVGSTFLLWNASPRDTPKNHIFLVCAGQQMT